MGTKIPFGEWLPDLPPLDNPGATVAKNVIPSPQGYLSFPSQTVFSTSLGSRVKGHIVARDTAGNYFNYAADVSAIYAMVGTSWSSVNRLVGGAYGTAEEDYWEFAQFGNQVIGINGANADVPQVISIGAANFAALAGAPPRARHIAVVRDFVVMGNISATAVSPQMVRWCAINNAASWTPDAATLADFQDLPGDHGWVQKIIGGEYGTVFMERAIYRMTFVGSPLVFQFDKIQTNLGAFAPQSVASWRNMSFFLSEEGFCLFDGSNVIPIGSNKVDRTFFAEVDQNYIYRITAAIDPSRKIVAWAYPASGNSNGNPNKILIYNWATQRWSRVEGVNIEAVFRTASSAFTLEQLDAFSSSIDALSPGLDASQWAGGKYLFSCYDSGHRLNNFNGSAMTATVETPEVQPNQNGLSYVTEIRPLGQFISASATLALATRNTLNISATYITAAAPNSAGFAEVRSTARYFRFQLNIADGNFDYLQGVDISVIADGVR